MLRERGRIEAIIQEKDRIINQQKVEIQKLTANSTGLSPVGLGGSLRIHGSFRQYKKDREKFKQQLKYSDSSSGININSSEESSSSPSTLPRTQKGTLRPILLKEENKKSQEATEENSQNKLKKEEKVEPTKIQINPEDKSDSGRESEDIEHNVSVITVSTDSANSSFDGSDPTLGWKIKIEEKKPVKKVKPPPPPRSSQTRLSTIKPKSILSPKTSLNAELSPTEALDHLIRHGTQNKLRQSEKKKRVKFNPKIDTSTTEYKVVESVTPLDPHFLHFLQQDKQDTAKKTEKNNFSYYEPYI